MPKQLSASTLRKLVTERAHGCCEYCMSQERFSSGNFSLEHILPIILGGKEELDNLALACQACNNFKYIKIVATDPETGEVVPLFNPRTQEWRAHFGWNENFTVVIGLTPSGRATVKTMQLNREFLMNQRVMYRLHGVHPPAHSQPD